MAQVVVKGLSDLNKFLQELPAKVEANVLRGALYAGAKVVRDEAKRLAPVAPPTAKNRRLYGGRAGALRDSIRAGAMVDKRAGKVMAYIRAGSHGKGRKAKGLTDAYYATWVEYGTQAHWIKATYTKSLALRPNSRASSGFAKRWVRSLVIGGNFVGPSVRHPGARPKPFMRPALHTKARDAVMAAAVYMRQRLATKHGLTQAAALEFE